MKITNIKRKKGSNSIYVVIFKPNCIEKLFGAEETQKEYKDTGSAYIFGGGTVYVDKNGNNLENGCSVSEEIDKWRRSW